MSIEPTYLFAKAILKPFMAGWFDLHIEGREHIPRDGAAILAFNHISFLDPILAAYVVDSTGRHPRFLAKAELFDDKRIAWILRGAKQIPVKRGSREAPMALDHALKALQDGEVVVIFPEGTITNDPDLHPMEAKTGISRLALATKAPVLPAAVWGTANVWPKGYSKHWWPPGQDLCARVGPPLRVEGDPDDPKDWASAAGQIMGEVSRLVSSLRPAVPDRRRPRKRAA